MPISNCILTCPTCYPVHKPNLYIKPNAYTHLANNRCENPNCLYCRGRDPLLSGEAHHPLDPDPQEFEELSSTKSDIYNYIDERFDTELQAIEDMVEEEVEELHRRLDIQALLIDLLNIAHT